MVIFKYVFSALIMRFFDKRIIKFWTLEKLENMMKKDCFFEKKTRSSFEIASVLNLEAQNLPVAAGRLVFQLSSCCRLR